MTTSMVCGGVYADYFGEIILGVWGSKLTTSELTTCGDGCFILLRLTDFWAVTTHFFCCKFAILTCFFLYVHVHVNVMYMHVHVCLTSVCIPHVLGGSSLLDDFNSWFNWGVDIQLVVFGDLMGVYIAGRLD